MFSGMKKNFWIGFGFICLVAVILASSKRGSNFPSDAELRGKWNDDMRIVLSLNTMIDSLPPEIVGIGSKGVMFGDQVNQVPPDAAGMPKSLYDNARKQMKMAGISKVLRVKNENLFLFSAHGFGGAGFRIFFAYRKTPPESVIPSVDAFRRKGQGTTAYVSLLENNWYVKIVW